MHARFATVAVVVSLLGWWSRADAGRVPWGWSYGTEVNPERMIESEVWISEENKKGDLRADETLIWWAPTIGITAHLEAAIPIEIARSHDAMTSDSTSIERWGGELRYRFNSPDPVEAGPFTALVRVAVKRLTAPGSRGGVRGEADAVFGYERGRVIVGVDLGVVTEVIPASTLIEFRPSGGIQIRAIEKLRLGAEVYSELSVQNSISWLVIGPSASWTHGRFWLATAYGVGVFGIHTGPRVKFGIQF
jgi:hypothetical protein